MLVRLPIGGVLLLGRGDLRRLEELRLRLLLLLYLGDLLGDRLSRLLERWERNRLLRLLLLLLLLLLLRLGLRLLDLLLKEVVMLPKRSKRSRDLLLDLDGMITQTSCDLY